MARGERRPRSRPRGDDDEPWPGTDYQHTLGDARSNVVGPEPTEAERKRAKRELREALRRKRPIGFQAKWDD